MAHLLQETTEPPATEGLVDIRIEERPDRLHVAPPTDEDTTHFVDIYITTEVIIFFSSNQQL